MTYSLCITNFNRYELLLESFSEVIHDDRIGEVVIVDDHSDLMYWNQVSQLEKYHPKIRVIRQLNNRGMAQNKADAIAYAKNEWVIILDSDNIIRPDYLEAIPSTLDPYVIYCPSFAWPNFDYRSYAGDLHYNRVNVPKLIDEPMFNCCMNTCNYVVNRDEYARVYKLNKEMKGTDTIWFAYLWLQAGNAFCVMENCTYFHRVHEKSGFMADVHYNMAQGEKIKQLIKQL